MNLTDESVIHYLLDKGVLDVKDVAEGNTLIVSAPTRNVILKILNAVPGEKQFILKQLSALEEHYYQLSKNESYVYHMIHNSKEYAPLSAFVPDLVLYDRERSVLVFEFLSNTTSLHEYYYERKDFDLEVSASQADILSSFHFTMPDNADKGRFTKQIPWILKILDTDPYVSFHNDPLKAQLYKYMVDYKELKSLLLNLRSEWEYSSLIHGDIKWSNFIIQAAEAKPKVYLIDWETCDVGDPAWDIGGLLQSYFSVWIFSQNPSLPVAGHMPASVPSYSFDTAKMQQSIVSLWHRYSSNRAFSPEEEKRFLVRSTKCAAARLIQTSLEALYIAKEVSATNYMCVHAAYNILSNPEFAIDQLFGTKIYMK